MRSRLAKLTETLLMDRVSEAFRASTLDPFPAGAHPIDYRRSGLGAFGKSVARSVAQALLCDLGPAGSLVAPSDAELERIVKKLDLWLGTASPELSRGFVALCLAIEGCPALVLRKFSTFRKLSLQDRLAVLEALEGHENGLYSMLLTAFKVPLATAAFEEGPMLRETGFDRISLSARRGAEHAR